MKEPKEITITLIEINQRIMEPLSNIPIKCLSIVQEIQRFLQSKISEAMNEESLKEIESAIHSTEPGSASEQDGC